MKRSAIIIVSAFVLLACAPMGKPVDSLLVDDISDAQGLYTLIYYLGTKPKDVRYAIVLDRQGDAYEFIPKVKDFEYEILQDVPVREALYEAQVFFRERPFLMGPLFERIFDDDNVTIGYEIRPLYHKSIFGQKDVLAVTYRLMEDNEIQVRIALKPGLRGSEGPSFIAR
jgi:hypothetical protein